MKLYLVRTNALDMNNPFTSPTLDGYVGGYVLADCISDAIKTMMLEANCPEDCIRSVKLVSDRVLKMVPK